MCRYGSGSPVTDETAGFTGAQGWLALGQMEKGASVAVSLSDGGQTVERTLVGAVFGGFLMIFQ